MSDTAKIPTQRIIRDKYFAKRIEIACENHPLAPSGHGRGKWLRDQMLEQFSVKVSAEAVRKWFSGEARPRPKIMSQLARVLGVDEAWFSLGITPKSAPREERKHKADASGVINLVAAHIQLAGGNIAFADEDGPDLFAIVRGKHHSLNVRLVGDSDKTYITLPFKPTPFIAVAATERPTVYKFFRVSAGVVEQYGKVRGGYAELEIERRENEFYIDGRKLREIVDFADLENLASDLKVRIKAGSHSV